MVSTKQPLLKRIDGLRRVEAVQVDLPGRPRWGRIVGIQYPLSRLCMRRQSLRPVAEGDYKGGRTHQLQG